MSQVTSVVRITVMLIPHFGGISMTKYSDKNLDRSPVVLTDYGADLVCSERIIMQVHNLDQSLMFSHTHTLTLMLSHTHTHTQRHLHTNAPALSPHTHTHTHTQSHPTSIR